jgi:hypothetical protein
MDWKQGVALTAFSTAGDQVTRLAAVAAASGSPLASGAALQVLDRQNPRTQSQTDLIRLAAATSGPLANLAAQQLNNHNASPQSQTALVGLAAASRAPFAYQTARQGLDRPLNYDPSAAPLAVTRLKYDPSMTYRG